MTQRSLLDIESFGGTAAEDDDIKRYFVETPAFDKLLGGRKHLVIGRKGSGKTALYLALAERARASGRLAAGLSFKQYPWQAHYRYASGDATTERFVASWTFLILIEAFDQLATSGLHGRPRPVQQAVGEVRKFIERNYGRVQFDYKDAFPRGGFQVDNAQLQPRVAGSGLGGVTSRRSSQNLCETLQRLNEWLSEKLRQCGADIPEVFVLFDELDLGFDPQDRNYSDRVIGLLLAARSIIGTFTRAGTPVHPVVFLRSDIFDLLHFGDKNKIVSAEAIELTWHDRLDHRDASLKHLIDARIKSSLELENLTSAWDAAFDSQLTRGTQHKFQHMTYRTLLRPRDIIRFCNDALEAAQARLLASEAAGGLISNADIKAARAPYSSYLKRELDDEIAEAQPKWDNLPEVLRSIGAAKFEREDFARGFARAEKKLEMPLSMDEALQFLYRYSIIGFERKAPTGSGLTHHFRYQGEEVLFERDARSFLVHRGLKEVLGLTETLGDES